MTNCVMCGRELAEKYQDEEEIHSDVDGMTVRCGNFGIALASREYVSLRDLGSYRLIDER